MAVPGAPASVLRGPHIAFLPGRIACPLAGVGARAANASNRLVVDDPATRVIIDGGVITIEDDRACAPRTAVADLVWIAEGPAPFTIHLEVEKTDHAWSIDLHTHEPAPLADRRAARYEPFTVVAVDRGSREVLVDREELARSVQHVPLGRRLSGKLMTMRDHRRPGDPALFDRSIGVGALGRGSFLVRVRLAPLAAAPPAGSLATMLAAGEWELAIEALTDRWLPEIVARDLRLYGIAGEPLLAELAAGRLQRGQTLAFRTTGEVRLDDRTAPLADARDLARTYIEFHMLGGIIAAALR